MLKDIPVMKKLVATGEERVGRLVQQLMSNERFVLGVQGILSRSLQARGALDKALRAALAAANLPSTADLEGLRAKLDELEGLLEQLEAKLDQLAEKQ
jgi:hypothetical protein